MEVDEFVVGDIAHIKYVSALTLNHNATTTNRSDGRSNHRAVTRGNSGLVATDNPVCFNR
jgi:hypothetical protein